METYIATFHTHLSALRSWRALQSAGFAADMEPVPRKLSASCGTCVRYTADAPHPELLDREAEAVYNAVDYTPVLELNS